METAETTTEIRDFDIADAVICDAEIIEEVKAPFFKEGNVHSDTFPCSAWLCRTFGLINSQVWWGYKAGYYPLVFLPFLIATFSIDVVVCLCLYRLIIGYVGKRLFDLIMDGITPFAKIIMSAVAVIIVTLFISHQGWDGLNSLYEYLCGSLSGLFGGSPSQP